RRLKRSNLERLYASCWQGKTPPSWIASRSAGCATIGSVRIAHCPQPRANAIASTQLLAWPSAENRWSRSSGKIEAFPNALSASSKQHYGDLSPEERQQLKESL